MIFARAGFEEFNLDLGEFTADLRSDSAGGGNERAEMMAAFLRAGVARRDCEPELGADVTERTAKISLPV